MPYEYAVRNLDRRVWYLSLARFIRAMGRVSSFIFLPLIFVAVYNVSFLVTGLILGVATLIQAVFQYFSGMWTDRVGRRIFLIVMPVPVIALYFLMYFIVSDHLPFYYLAAAWYGTMMANAIQFPAIQAAVADLTSVSYRLSGFTVLRVMANLGAAVGPILGGFLSIYGFQLIFLLAGISTVAEVSILYLYVSETYFPLDPSPGPHIKETKFAYRDHFFLIFTIAGIFWGFFLRQNGPALTLYVFDLQNLPVLDLGFIYALNGTLVVALQFPILRLISRISTPVMWRSAGVIFYAAAFILLAVSNQFLLFLLVMAIMTIGEDFVAPTTQTIITTLAAVNLRGTYIGVYNLYSSIGRFFGAFIGLAMLYFFRNITSSFWVYVAIGTLAVSLWYFLLNRPFIKRMDGSEETTAT
ncbi:multidrug transporter [uncultured archaeon]|nr:multidrug transporter [uncultured archaeon]